MEDNTVKTNPKKKKKVWWSIVLILNTLFECMNNKQPITFCKVEATHMKNFTFSFKF